MLTYVLPTKIETVEESRDGSAKNTEAKNTETRRRDGSAQERQDIQILHT